MIVPDSDASCEFDAAPLPRLASLARRRALTWLAASGFALSTSSVSSAGRVPLALASSLRFAWPSMVRAAGLTGFAPSFGASRTLARQLQQGAPFQLLLSADARSIALVEQAGITRVGSAIDYASGRLVMLAWRTPDRPRRVEDLPRWLLDDASHRLAIAHPAHAPYGLAATQTLDVLGLRAQLDWRSRPERIVRGENANQALQFFLSGAAGVALVPASLQRAHVASQRSGDAAGRTVSLPVDAALHDPLRHRAIATQRAGANALALLDTLRGTSVQAALVEHGFGPPLDL